MAELLDMEIVEGLRELQSEDDPHFIKRYFDSFLGDFPGRIQAMKKAIESKESKKLAAEAHALKSSCANSGVNSLMTICQDLEKDGKAGVISPDALEKVAKLDEQFQLLRKEIAALPEYK